MGVGFDGILVTSPSRRSLSIAPPSRGGQRPTSFLLVRALVKLTEDLHGPSPPYVGAGLACGYLSGVSFLV